MYIVSKTKITEKLSFLIILIGFYITKKHTYYIYYTDEMKPIHMFINRNKFLCNNVKDVITYLQFHKGEN